MMYLRDSDTGDRQQWPFLMVHQVGMWDLGLAV